MDFAPVADVTTGVTDPTIRSRSAGDSATRVADTVIAAVDGYLASGIVPVVKHFPGHGSVSTDSHAAIPTQSASIAALSARDLVPFQEAIDAGAPAVMMGHIAVEAWGNLPATLDPQAYAYLRDEMGFTGLAVTDALNMGAVASVPGDAAVAALAAGADVLLMPADPRAARDAIVDAIRDGDVPRSRLDDALSRVILAGRWQGSLDGAGSGGKAAGGGVAAGGTASGGAARLCARLRRGRGQPGREALRRGAGGRLRDTRGRHGRGSRAARGGADPAWRHRRQRWHQGDAPGDGHRYGRGRRGGRAGGTLGSRGLEGGRLPGALRAFRSRDGCAR
ncbi:glycoside hydrolase family 3 N-terminal domain-containing protein [Demequina litorisediminis]|uniref:beta-N-acetylhexosaminidase n=1 Tax=Demequina litorisediminis TaxID=1849022 RepID=A0ABQ6IEH5_9MICO|nr:glycoside hydrolase family 3 N-terminal domain-containing protein [Demequina litorisediminis]GMA36278.1 hypothetical protein GCM10025876_24820 [Demequina litorisediminis]